MYNVIAREELAEGIVKLEVLAPHIAAKRKPGQFCIVRTDIHSERIPLSITDGNVERGTITLVVREVGTSTRKIVQKQVGDTFANVAGPLGRPTEINHFGRVVCIGGGVGIAPLYPITKALRAAGNSVVSILGGRSQNLVLLREEMKRVSHQILICTDDGSLGRKGLVTDLLLPLLKATPQPNMVIAIGPTPMMKKICELTKSYNVPTIVSLNSLMVDGTGMCGGCRVIIGGEIKFVCVDGPEFDGHKVDFDAMMQRLAMYREFERISYENAQKPPSAEPPAEPHQCKLELAIAAAGAPVETAVH